MPGLPIPIKRKRVISYIDGFNLYFGLRDSEWRQYLWLDLTTLGKSLILDYQDLVTTKYFTSRIAAPPDKRKRQLTYLEALEAHCGKTLQFYFGHYQSDPRKCQNCGAVEDVPSEKKTDVNIAVEIMTDAFSDSFDTALLITADSDLIPAVQAVKRLFPDKRIVVAFPPARHSVELKQEAHTSFTIGRAKFAQAQMPEMIVKPDGKTKLTRPAKWTISRTEFGAKLGAAMGSPE